MVLPGASGQRILVSDIDGTLLRDGHPTAGLRSLRILLEAHRGDVRLVLATGRSFSSTWDLVSADVLPRPDAVASFVGTEVWMPPWREPLEGYSRHILRGWDRELVDRVVRGFETVRPQPDEFQSLLKASYFLEDASLLADLERALGAAGARAHVIHSGGIFLDVLPERAGKRGAIEYILAHWGVPASKVMACGDSMNDLDMLRDPQFLGVIVGNGEDELRQVASCESSGDSLHESELPFAAGVLEGAEVFRFWPV
jgi:sucrose-6F-phosphate phosphohydrolase